MSLQCEFCFKTFVSLGNLNKHIKQAKSCLKKRINLIDEIKTNFQCQYCEKYLYSKIRLKNHYKSCDKYLVNQAEEKNAKDNQAIINNLKIELKQKEIQNKKQEEAILDLQKTIARLAEKAISKETKTTNNTTTNIQDNSKKYLNVQSLDLSEERINNLVDENLTLKHVQLGSKGITTFIKDVLGKVDGKCIIWSSDKSRNQVNFIDEDGNLVKDVNGLIVLTNTVPSIESQAKKILSHYQKTFYHPDMTHKTLEEIKEEEEDEEEEFQRYLQDKREREKKMNTQVENEINYIKERYDKERISHNFNRGLDGYLNICEVKDNPEVVSKNLAINLPDKPNRITKFDWDNDQVRDPRFKYDPKKILGLK